MKRTSDALRTLTGVATLPIPQGRKSHPATACASPKVGYAIECAALTENRIDSWRSKLLQAVLGFVKGKRQKNLWHALVHYGRCIDLLELVPLRKKR